MSPRGRHRTFVRTVTDAEYSALLDYQGGGCALCHATPKTRRLDLDHDHRAMKVRGLLCHRCNRSLPSWVTVEWLLRAVEYLNHPPADRVGVDGS